jgi:hypothetical protein
MAVLQQGHVRGGEVVAAVVRHNARFEPRVSLALGTTPVTAPATVAASAVVTLSLEA